MNKEEKTKQLENELMSLGLSGMAYSPMWNLKAERLNKLKSADKTEQKLNRRGKYE